jgi:hypothetical protein
MGRGPGQGELSFQKINSNLGSIWVQGHFGSLKKGVNLGHCKNPGSNWVNGIIGGIKWFNVSKII